MASTHSLSLSPLWRRMLAGSVALALAGSSLALGSAAAATEPFAAPEVSGVTASSVDLDWAVPADPAITGFAVQVFAGAAAEPEVERVLGDPTDTSIVTRSDIAAGRAGATIRGLAEGVVFQFLVRAFTADAAVFIDSERTADVSTLTTPPPAAEAPVEAAPEVAAEPVVEQPAAPSARASAVVTTPTAVAKGGTAISVDWAAYSSVATPDPASIPYYTVSVYSAATDALVKLMNFFTVTTGVVTGLAVATDYTVEVKEMATTASSGHSAVVSTFAEIGTPGVIPGTATAETVSGSELLVSWPALVDGVEARFYDVRAYLDDVQVQLKQNLNPYVTGTTTSFTGLRSNTEYSFTVTAKGWDANGTESVKSAPFSTAKGVAPAMTAPTLVRSNAVDTSITARWATPTLTGGYDVTGYLIEYYSTASIATFNLLAVDEVDATELEHELADHYLVGAAIGVRVAAISAAGIGVFSPLSASLTVAATNSPVLAVSGTAVNQSLSSPTADGFTLSWMPTAAANENTGYAIRIVQHLPTNSPTNSTNYTASSRDLGTGWASSGALSTVITGLDAGSTYRVSITGYQKQADGTLTYRNSGTRVAAITTLGSAVPAKQYSKAATPVVTGVDSISWAGPIHGATLDGGSPIIGYRVALFENGARTAVQSSDISVTMPDDNPAVAFTGLKRDTFYQVRVAAINANGVGQFSDVSDGVRTLLRPAPGSIAPEYATFDALRAAIGSRVVEERMAKDLGIAAIIESNTELLFFTEWAGSADPVEAWLYSADDGATFLDTVQIAAGEAIVDVSIGDVSTGTYYLAIFGEGATPVAVKLSITKPVTGPTELDDAVFRWGFNNESNNGAFAGGCNFFAAGASPDIGRSTVFTSSRYSSVEGNVSIVKPNASGAYVPATFSNKCLTRSGSPVTTSPTTAFTDSQVVITGGEGTVDPSTNSGEIQWTGTFTVAYYGGMTYWYATDPKLVVENGEGTITAIASGYASDMADSSKWEYLAPREITLANLSGVKMTSSGFTVTPDFLGVKSESSGGAHSPQVARDFTNSSYWGSFPADFIEFQEETAQVAYWYSSGGSQDRAKPTLPLYVGYDATTAPPTAGEEGVTGPGISIPVNNAPAGVPVALRFGSAAAQAPINDLESLLAYIDAGAIQRVEGADAGLPPAWQVGERLDLDFAWAGPDSSGSIWLYPDLVYAGSFTVKDGRVTVSLDSSAFTSDGEKFITFFGDAGTAVTVVSTATGFVETPMAITTGAADVSTVSSIPPADASSAAGILLIVVIGLGVVLLGTGAAITTVLVRRPKVV